MYSFPVEHMRLQSLWLTKERRDVPGIHGNRRATWGPFNTKTKWSQMERDVIRQKSNYQFLVLRYLQRS